MDETEKNPQDSTETSQTLDDVSLIRPDLRVARKGEASLQVEVVGGPMDGQRCTVRGPSLTIGRSEHSDLSLALDPLISSAHARILHDGKRFWLEDLDSRNGTYVGDRRIRKREPIRGTALFTIGRTCLEFSPR